MRKTLSLFLSLIFVTFSFASCVRTISFGTYKVESIGGKTPLEWFSGDSSDEIVDGLLDLIGISKDDLNDYFYVLTIEEGGKATVYSQYEAMFNEDGNPESEGVWTLDGDVLTVTVNGKDVILTFENGVLTRDFNGEKGVFRKD